MATGYITGSGNYFDFFIPVAVPDGVTVTGVSFTSASRCFANSRTVEIGTSATVSQQTKLGILCEIQFSNTQTANNTATAYLISLQITCS